MTLSAKRFSIFNSREMMILSLFSELETLGELMADNLEQQGVTASANDGLTTLANKILDISGGSCYHIELSEHSVTTTGTFTISATLQEDYQLKSGATVTFTGGTSTVTATTDSSGVATATVTFTGDGTLTATYGNVSDTATITYSNYLFYDPCTSDNTSQYSTRGKMGGTNTSISMSYNSSQTAYQMNGSGGDYFGWFAIPNIRGLNQVKITVKVKLATQTAYNQLMIGMTDTQNQNSSSSFTADVFRIRADNKSDFLHNSGNEISGSSSSTTVYNQYVYVEFLRNGSTIVGKVYNESMSLLRTYTYTTNNSYTNPYFFVGMNCRNTSDIKYIQEIKVESV